MPYIETTSVIRTVSARIGANMRKARTERGMTQAQLASPEFSVSYISAIEHGKLRPSLKALSVLAQRLKVPVTALLETAPATGPQARTLGYSPVNTDQDDLTNLNLLQAAVLVQQGAYEEAMQLLSPLASSRLTPSHAYRYFLLRGQIALKQYRPEEAIADLYAALTQAESLKEREQAEQARNLLGKAYLQLSNYKQAEEYLLSCALAVEEGQIIDFFFALEVYSNLVDAFLAIEEFEKADAFAQRAQALLKQLSNDERSYAQLAMENSQQSSAAARFALAEEQARRSLSIYQMRDLQLEPGRIHLQLGKILEKQQKLDEAEQEFLQAIEVARPLNDEAAFAQSLIAQAELSSKRGDIQRAEQEAQEAVTLAQASNDVRTQGQALLVLAQLRHQAGDYAGSDLALEEALSLLEEAQDHELAASVYFRYAEQLEERGEIQRSLDAVKHAYRHQRADRNSV
ncbi:MAG TPA: helix-turn-helix domain-containing protein [Ktedonobacteraceae bacterium]|nr:helix-turn-helix domain-containing protein [Ktedonobacteraceae bacterium]